MLREHSILCVALRKYVGFLAFATAAVLLVGSAAWGDDGKKVKTEPAVRLLTTIPVPVTAAAVSTAGGLFSYDISWVDQGTQRYYLADRSNNVVDVVNANNSTFNRQIAANPPFKGFVTPAACALLSGTNCSGPNAVATAGGGLPWLFVTDGGSRVVTIDVTTDKTVSDVVTKAGDPNRADEIAYDPKDGILLVVNPNETTPFFTLISVNKATGKLTPGPNISLPFATGGAEQPVWDPGTGKFFLSIPQIFGITQLGAVIPISTTGVIGPMIVVPLCGPAGLTLGPNDELLVGCNTTFDTAGMVWSATDPNTATPYRVILDAKTGFIEAYIPGVGPGDEVWFNSGDGHYYTADSGSPLAPSLIVAPAGAAAQGAAELGVIDAFSRTLDQLVPTFNVGQVGPTASPVHPAGTAHSVAANAKNNRVFVPLAANNVYEGCLDGCIAVYGRSDKDKD
jgi:hypothetical protein